MAGKKPLEPVDMDSEPVGGSVTEAAEKGTRLDSLKALRRVITRHIDSDRTLARDLAALSRQYISVSKEIEELEALEQQYSDEAVGVDDGAIEDAPFRAEDI
ncbi:hypothetical protein [uncultured Rothia sp.]|uniref:hypothetical protein n=1 Tax=uncultured Rothia sp. TaxID=316088 RepID=UPI003217660E